MTLGSVAREVFGRSTFGELLGSASAVLTALDGRISVGVEVGESVAIGLASLLPDVVLTTRVSLSWPDCPSLLLGANSPVSLTVEGASDVSGTVVLWGGFSWIVD